MSRIAQLRAVLLVLAAGAALVAGALPSQDKGARGGGGDDDFRVIVRLADGGGSGATLQHQVEKLQQKSGVVQTKVLHQLGMAVVQCSSEEAQEQLLDELERDDAVELAVPDSWVSVDDFKPGAADADKEAAPAGGRKLQDDRAQCSANPACAARGLAGACCPAADGTMLSCCSMHDEPTTVVIGTYHGTYISAGQGGSASSRSNEVLDGAKFELINNDNGTVSFRTAFGTYLTAEESGSLVANRATIEDWEKFTLVFNENMTISLKTFFGNYVTAEVSGSVLANRSEAGLWEQFHIQKVAGPHQRLPNDPSLSQLWGMNSWNARDIDAPEAWKMWTGELSAGIVVGVIDTGIDYNHEDLSEQMWVNPNEIPGNGIDDDGNGYVDDVHGADFANEDGDPWDDQLHGTHCSGTIAGIGNNGIGVAGVAWRGVRLMGLKFLTATGSGRTSDAIKAIDYAVAHGAKILSNSWGGGGSSSAMRVAIERAEAAGLLFIAAAGNSGTDNDEEPHYPSNYEVDNIVSVASTTHKGELSSFSCYGNKTVHVAAPGSQIYSTAPKNHYKYLSGTSMATPHVSGLAALVWMYRPQLSMQQVREIIFSSVEKYSSLDGKLTTNGLINAKNALETAWAFEPPRPPAHAPAGLAFEDVDPGVGSFAGVVTITAAADESDIEYYRVYFFSQAGFQLEPLGEKIPATGASELTLKINGSFVPPKFAAALVAVSGRKAGEMHATAAGHAPRQVLEDYGVPDMGPQAVRWGGDANLRQGLVEGTLYVNRAKTEASISQYNIYWRNASGARGALLGKISAIGFRKPSCSGWSCDVIDIKQEKGVYTFDRSAYGDNEAARITASGPGTVTVTRLETEDFYDALTVGEQHLSGDLSSALPHSYQLEAGLAEIVWLSDASVNAGGWTFTLEQSGATVAFQISATELKGEGVEVVTAFGENEFEEGAIFVRLADYDEAMPPSPAFTPASVAFEDVNPGAGIVAGTITVEPVSNAAAGRVDFYHVGFADSEAKPIGGDWRVVANGTAAVSVAIPATPVPAGATQIVARSGNGQGLSTGYTSAELIDVMPYSPGNVTWSGDSDARPGIVSGDLVIDPAESEVGLIAYVVYWYEGAKVAEVARKAPTGTGGAIKVHLPYGTKKQGSSILVVSTYAWGETEEGSSVDIEDWSSRGRLLAETLAAATNTEKPTKASEPPADAMPWLERPQDVAVVAWAAERNAGVSALAARYGRVRSAVTIPGLEASVAAQPGTRAACARAIAAGLPRVEAEHVHVVRVFELTPAAAARTVPGGRQLTEEVRQSLNAHRSAVKIEFEVEPPSHGAAALDRVEARLILLSHGGSAAAKFDLALARELAAAGARLPQTETQSSEALRFRVAEPKQLGPKMVAARAEAPPGGRRLAEGVAVDTSMEEGTSDEQAGAAGLAAMSAGLLALCVSGAAALVVIRRRAGAKLFVEKQVKADGADEPLQAVCVDSPSDDAE